MLDPVDAAPSLVDEPARAHRRAALPDLPRAAATLGALSRTLVDAISRWNSALFSTSATAFKSGCSRKGSIPDQVGATASSVRSRNAALAASFQSPLTDSNRRPPPYHALRSATGRNLRQRFWLVSEVFGRAALATDCHQLQPRGSIRAPSFVISRGNRIVVDLQLDPFSSRGGRSTEILECMLDRTR
jgi:hypothetical protein